MNLDGGAVACWRIRYPSKTCRPTQHGPSSINASRTEKSSKLVTCVPTPAIEVRCRHTFYSPPCTSIVVRHGARILACSLGRGDNRVRNGPPTTTWPHPLRGRVRGRDGDGHGGTAPKAREHPSAQCKCLPSRDAQTSSPPFHERKVGV